MPCPIASSNQESPSIKGFDSVSGWAVLQGQPSEHWPNAAAPAIQTLVHLLPAWPPESPVPLLLPGDVLFPALSPVPWMVAIILSPLGIHPRSCTQQKNPVKICTQGAQTPQHCLVCPVQLHSSLCPSGIWTCSYLSTSAVALPWD